MYFVRNRICDIIFIGAITTQFLIGCGTEFSSKKNGNTQTKDSRVKTESDDDRPANAEKYLVPEIKITGLEPFQYQAEINWSDKLKNVSVFSNGALSFKTLSPGVTNCIFELEHNKEYKIQVYANLEEKVETPLATNTPLPITKDTEDRELIKEWVIQTPLDIELSFLSIPFGFTFPWDIKAHRVFIDHEMPVVTDGFDLKIDTDELIILKKSQPDKLDTETFTSDSATKAIKEAASIYTFSDDQLNEHVKHDSIGRPISFWSDGKNGGQITIKAKTAVGNLNIFLRGQNGADGVDGLPYTERAAQGPAGELADYDMFNCGGGGGFKKVCACRKNEDRENGRQGAKGAPGRNGGDGGKGGNSGSVRIEIAEPSPGFKVSTTSEFGLSGNPGKAGPPQLGGLGGPPVNKEDPFIIYMCREPQQGPEGLPGDPGHDGIKQSNGIIEQNCISIGEGFGRCAN